MVTVNTLLSMPSLADLVIVAGKAGLSKEINAVATLDAPDGPSWLRGNELILTSAYIFGEDVSQIETFVENLIKVGATGLAFKMGRFLKQVPSRIVELADRNAFPIIMIPQRLVWSDIIAPFYELTYKINSKDNIIKIEPKTIDQLFMAGRWGSRQMMMKLTELFEVPIMIVKKSKKAVADNGLPGNERIQKALADPNLFLESKEGNHIIKNADSYLLVCQFPFSRIDNMEYFALLSENENFVNEMFALFQLFSRLYGETDFAERGKSELYRKFLLGIVSGGITDIEIHEFSANRICEGASCHDILLISAENRTEIYEKLQNEIKDMYKGRSAQADSYFFYDENNAETVVLLELPRQKEQNFNGELRELMSRIEPLILTHKSNCVAIGNVCEISRIKTCYRQACEAKRIGRLLYEEQCVYFFSSLAIYCAADSALLSELDISDVLFLERNKNPLSFDGIATLEAFIECGNYRKAAAKLYIHENTLRYRVQKLGELLHLDVEQPLLAQCLLFKIKVWKLTRTTS